MPTGAQPEPFDFWLEYLALQPDLASWEETFDRARVNWRIDLCWRLLREARRRAAMPLQLAILWHSEGLLQAQSGDWPGAETCYRKALDALPSVEVERRLLLLGDVGMLHRLRGDTQATLEVHRQQLELAQAQGQVWLQADALGQLGLDCETNGDWANAREYLERALTLHQNLSHADGVAVSHKHLGLVLWRQGELVEAQAYLEQSLAAFERSGQRYDMAQTEGNLGNLCYERDDLEGAERHYRRTLSIVEELGVISDKIGLLNNLGALALARQDYDQTARFYHESLALTRELGDRCAVELMKQGLAHDLRYHEGMNADGLLRDLAETYLWMDDLNQGLAILAGLLRNDPSDIWTYNVMAIIFDRFGLADLGLEAAQRGLELVEATGDPEKLHDQLTDALNDMQQSERRGREAEVDSTVLADFCAALALDFGAGQRRPVTELCWELVPDLDRVPVKRPAEMPELLPPPALDRRRQSRQTDRKLRRNDPCWCGSGKKYKHCHMRSDRSR